MRWTLVSLALVMALMPSSARSKTSAYNTGNTLLSMCEGQPPFDVLGEPYCTGYVVGIADALSIEEGVSSVWGWKACIPDSVSRRQLRDVVVKYLQNNPETRDETAASLTAAALAMAFPCQ